MLRVNRSVFKTFVQGVLALAVFLTLGCSSNEKKSDTAEGAFALAQEFEKDERYEEAIRRYQELKNKFPYSKYATMAELALADCHYKQEAFPEAQAAYQIFKDLHPKHQQIDYVTFRLGMSYFLQLPSSIDRDLTLASNAILQFDELKRQFPQSTYLAEATAKRDATIKMLAEKENYIADFYFKREKFDSALNRYEGLLAKYSGQGFDEIALSRAAISAARIGEMERAQKLFSDLREKFPQSAQIAEVAKVVR